MPRVTQNTIIKCIKTIPNVMGAETTFTQEVFKNRFPYLDWNNTEYFVKIIPCKFKVGDYVYLKRNITKYDNWKCKYVTVIPMGDYKVFEVNDDGTMNIHNINNVNAIYRNVTTSDFEIATVKFFVSLRSKQVVPLSANTYKKNGYETSGYQSQGWICNTYEEAVNKLQFLCTYNLDTIMNAVQELEHMAK